MVTKLKSEPHIICLAAAKPDGNTHIPKEKTDNAK